MSTINNLFESTLRDGGFSLTAARQSVFVKLENAEPQTMNELIKSLPAIDRASIYRTIKLFEDLGIVKRLQIGWKYKLELSDNFNPHHHHISCVICSKVVTLHENEAVENVINSLAAQHGFFPTDHQLEIQGRCETCENLQTKT